VCLAAHEPTLAARDRRIAELDETLAERDGLLQSILSSESWRLTAPLRLAGGYGKRVHRLLRVVPERVRATGGLRPAAEKALAIYRNEGLPGIRRRWASREAQEIALPEISAFAAPTTAFAFDPQAGYALRQGPAGYAYVPPRRPDNLAHICQNMVRRPQFSILVPVYDTPPEILRKTIDSVLAQWYPDWELILADDASTDPATRQCLAQLAHPAITVLHLPENRGISGASNAALARARGDYVVLLDHDDELTEDCLFELALCIEGENPDYIYSDEDKIGADGAFTEPHFKPDWSPDTLMSTMYVCHVSCIRRELLNEIDGFRSEFDGCQDWDLILRLTERTQRIHHLPKVLYHWRIIPASTAADIAAKPYILERSRQVREEALARRGLSGTIEAVEQVKGYFRVNYRLSGNPLISVIIPSRDNAAILRRCVASIQERSSYRNFEIIIVDNGSVAPDARDYLDAMQRRGQATVLRHDQPFNFSQLNNVGAEAARGDILLFLNDDTEVLTADWLERLGGYARLAHVGAVGAKLLYPGGKRIQHAGIVNFADGPGHAFFGLDADVPGYFMRNLLEYDWLAVTGACLMVEKTKFVAVGGFDERFPVAYNDVDFCLRLRASGYYNVVGQAVRLIHHESASRGNDHASPVKLARLERDKKCLFATHPQYLQHDPFHSPNLHPNGFHFETVS
jgi:GT2 family glycosyltransferase